MYQTRLAGEAGHCAPGPAVDFTGGAVNRDSRLAAAAAAAAAHGKWSRRRPGLLLAVTPGRPAPRRTSALAEVTARARHYAHAAEQAASPAVGTFTEARSSSLSDSGDMVGR